MKLPNYLRSCRKKARLSQGDVAFLLGSSNSAEISQHERFKRMPSLRTALAYEVIFHAPVRVLFAGFYREIEKKTERRAMLLAARLARKAQSPKNRTSVLGQPTSNE